MATNTRRPRVVTIIVTFLAVSAAASILLGPLQDAVRLDPTTLEITQFSTLAGALVVWLIWRRRLPFPHPTRHGLRTPLIGATALSVAIIALLVVVAAIEHGPWRPLDLATLSSPLPLVLAAQFVGAAGEEIGWRGLVQPLFETRMPKLLAALSTGFLFGLGHFAVLSVSVGAFAVFVLSAIGLSLALAATTTGLGWKRRILIATTLHWLVNIGMLLLFSNGDNSLLWIIDTALATVLTGAACIPRLVGFRQSIGPAPASP